MGALPIARLDALSRFKDAGQVNTGDPGDRNRRILEGVVSGIAHYGNCFGVPTVGGRCDVQAQPQRQSAGGVFWRWACSGTTKSSTAALPAWAIR